MAEEKNLVPSPVKNFIDRFTPSQRIFLVTVIVLTIIVIILIINAATTFNYGVLFSNLTSKDSGLILEQLKSKKVPYKIVGDGSVIKVPEDRIPELRIELAAGGLPEGGCVGFEIFDKSSLSTTDFVQNINYIRAVEGELARSISQLREVSSAKVHITMPKRSVFIEDQEPAKASIILKMKPGAQFSGNIVPAILHLTAQSVEGLRPENIAVVDVAGNLLSTPADGREEMFDDSRFGYQKDLENSFSRKIINLLEPIVGPGKVRANVKLTLDFDKVETTEETVDPDRIAKVSEKSETSSSTGGIRAGGIPGVSSNVAQAGVNQNNGVSGSNTRSRSENSLVNYEVSKKVTHVIKPVGEIKKISAAVVVDDGVRVETIDGQLQRDIIKRSPEELQTFTRLVQAAVGYNAERGDIVEVANLSFDTSALTESDFLQEKEKNKELIDNLIKYGIYALIIILLFFLILRPIFKKVIEIIKDTGDSRYEGMNTRRLDRSKMSAFQEARDNAEIEKELIEQYKIPKSSKKSSIIRNKVVDFAGKNIDETASLVRSFLVED
ncbi:MAG TPA: flagellar basal-body MS-ring/collar protein FliF [Candidatus Kapabacteria bacterium]|nr:flagellar basal-body MS-ring/collar protein FliF [Candidatus Kapabacteria bacterium]